MELNTRIYPVIKRMLDLVFSSVALVILSPLLLITALVVYVKLGSPILFTQKRPGKNQRIFKLYKFRSMSISTSDVIQIDDEERLSRFGSLLRSTSLDELPSLWNIAKGDMSFVGPRPLLVEYLSRYSERQQIRHQVDVQYVETYSAKVDFQIICNSLALVLTRKGTTAPGNATMPEFTGESFPR